MASTKSEAAGTVPGNANPRGAASGQAASAKLNTLGYFWALFSLGMVVASIGPSLPELATTTGVSLGAVGVAFSAYRGGYMVGSLAGGTALDRIAGNRLVAVGLLVMGGALALVPTVPLLPALVVVFVLIGIAGGVVEVGGNTLLVWVYREKVGPWMSGLHFAFGIGAMVSPFLIGQSLRITGGLPPAFLIAALLMAPGALLLLLTRTPKAPPQSDGDGGTGDLSMVLLVSIFLLLYIGVESSFGGWIYAWSIQVHSVTPAQAAILTSLFWGTITAGRLFSVPLASRLAPRTLLTVTVVGISLSLALIASPLGSASELVVWIAAAGAGLSMAAVFPTAMSFAGRHMRVTGSSSRWFFIGAGAGGMTIPWGIGQLMDATGPATVMPAILGVGLLMGGILWLLLMKVKRH